MRTCAWGFSFVVGLLLIACSDHCDHFSLLGYDDYRLCQCSDSQYGVAVCTKEEVWGACDCTSHTGEDCEGGFLGDIRSCACQDGTMHDQFCSDISNSWLSCPCPTPGVDGDADSDSEQEAEEEVDHDHLVDAPSTKAFCANAPEDWILRAGNIGLDWGDSVVVTPSGEVLFFGFFIDRIEFERATFTTEPEWLFLDHFVAKFDRQGNNLWAVESSKLLDPEDHNSCHTPFFAPDPDGGALLFGAVKNPGSSYTAMEYVLKTVAFAADGTSRSDFSVGVNLPLVAVATDAVGHLSIADQRSPYTVDTIDSGSYSAYDPVQRRKLHFSLAFGPKGGLVYGGTFKGRHFDTYSTMGSRDLFINELAFGSVLDDWMGNVVLDDENNVYASAVCPSACVNNDANSRGGVIVKVSNEGKLLWVRRVTSEDEADHPLLARDTSGRMFLSGRSIYRLNDEAQVIGEFPLPKGIEVHAIVPDEEGGVYLAGDVWGEVSLFCGTLKSAGSTDAFLMHVGTIPKVTTRRH